MRGVFDEHVPGIVQGHHTRGQVTYSERYSLQGETKAYIG